jgi:hypothetical protein
MTRDKTQIYFSFYLIVFFSLFLYSYTQVDLNLTLSRWDTFLAIQKKFTQIGYYNRPLSTGIFISIITILTTLYFLTIKQVEKKIITVKQLFSVIVLAIILLIFSYPAFSYDIFNYMFDAKTVVTYSQSPYSVKPLDFPFDPWLRFMHWTHRPSVYPPVWIGLTLIPYVLGMNKFLLILLNFKILIALAFLGTTYLVYQIAKLINIKNPLVPVVIFTLNPLMIIENLVSSHSDIVMIFFAVLAVYLLLQKKNLVGFLFILISGLIKYTTFFLLPLVFIQKKFPIEGRKVIRIATLLMLAGLISIITKIEIQPWYLVWILPFLSLWENSFILPLVIGTTLGLALRYAPFIYLGNWNPPAPQIKFWVTVISIVLGLIFTLIMIRKSEEP